MLTSEAIIAQFHKGWAVKGQINYRRVLRFMEKQTTLPSLVLLALHSTVIKLRKKGVAVINKQVLNSLTAW